MCYCNSCDFYEECDLAGDINFCEDCKDCETCTIKFNSCEAGHCIECNNGFEDKNDYCSDEPDEDDLVFNMFDPFDCVEEDDEYECEESEDEDEEDDAEDDEYI